MSQKWTVSFAVIFVLVSAFYYFYEIRWTGEEEGMLDESKKLFKFKAEDIEDMRIKNSKATLTLKKEEEDWFIIEPVRAKVNRAAVESIITTLVSERWIRELTFEEGDLSDFGLAQPVLEITLREKTLNREQTIQLGSKSPTGKFLYIRIDQGSNILMVRSWLKNILNKSIETINRGNRTD